MLEQLRRIHELCVKHQDYDSAGILDQLIDFYASDKERFWELLTSNEVWGGAGSLADQHLHRSVSSREACPYPKDELESDQRTVWRCLAEVADEMQAAGRVNGRTGFWAHAFRTSLDHTY